MPGMTIVSRSRSTSACSTIRGATAATRLPAKPTSRTSPIPLAGSINRPPRKIRSIVTLLGLHRTQRK
jgi:hypothetical protein